ncbi:MAG: RNA-guided pseudouridylation complex pseudouridine synthase subunit Cbf5 [Candidatus Helarchaeota archaeon]|nr:RNA-guided pseudouridylation complex pseudouridine synthase subunit Cbf5 [Candidatus Helarchaeota archaeon]
MGQPQSALPCDKDRNILIKAEDTTDPQYGQTPNQRSIQELIHSGIINLNKPSGPTSHEVTAWVKKILKIHKAGHSGTLDPKVTGVLPIALERSTKILKSLLKAGKEYVCIMHLHDSTPKDQVMSVIKEFIGPIYQRPPLRSSVKRKLRIRHIYYLNIIEYIDNDILFQIGCEAGTYIRKLCFDIGEALGSGAHMRELRRTRVSRFREDKTLVNLHDLLDAYTFWKEDGDESYLRKCIQPLELTVSQFPKTFVRDSAIDALCHGASLTAPGVLKISTGVQPNTNVAVMSLKGELIALGSSLMTSNQIIEADHGIVAKIDSVFMKPGTYPPWYSYKKNLDEKAK